MFRIGRLAGFVKANMPWGTTYAAPKLSDEEAWDVAAYINSMPRRAMNLEMDWPDISKKPFDYPYGPFIDVYKEEQHKYGPYTPIVIAQEKQRRN
ncbi:MAG TPA: cytochrome C, partial [Cyclobacteriaceae bacterium]|nr:cytochrome C [Cyclobacteriaceae bacterium]